MWYYKKGFVNIIMYVPLSIHIISLVFSTFFYVLHVFFFSFFYVDRKVIFLVKLTIKAVYLLVKNGWNKI